MLKQQISIMRGSLKAKFLAVILLIELLLGISIIILTETVLYQRLINELHTRNIYQANTLAHQCAEYLLDNDILGSRILLMEYQENMEDIEYVFLIDQAGRVLAHSFKGGFPLDLKKVNILKHSQAYSIEPLKTEKGLIYDVAVQILKGTLGSLHIGVREEPTKKIINKIIRIVIGLTMVVLILGAGLSVVLARVITKPILELIKVTRAVGEGDLEKEITVRTGDEIGQLAMEFNLMLQSLKKITASRDELNKEMVSREKFAILGQLAAGVSHELRNPLGVIDNACYFINMKKEMIKDEAVKKNIEIIKEEVNKANKIITDLLDYTMPKLPVSQKTDLNQLVRETISKALLLENIKITLDLASDLPVLSIDHVQVSKIFINLIENAVQAMGKKGGELKIVTRRIEKWVEVAFTDEGCGIAEKDLAKVFEPLFTTKSRGIGLGLAVSSSLARANKAIIWVESKENKGSTFTVRFCQS